MNDTGTDTATDPSATPPDLVASQSGYALSPDVTIAPRKVTSTAKSVTVQQSEFTPAGYIGQNLVDSKGVITRGQYATDEAYSELAKLGTAAERRAFLNLLAANGVYGRSKPSTTGFNTTDLSAMREALLYANARGVTVDVAARLMATDPAIQQALKSAAAAKRIRTTPTQDLRAVFKQTAQSVLGRNLSDAEADKFVRAYNASEVREGRGGTAAPSAQVAAQEAVTAAAPEEAGAMQMLGYANAVDQLMKGLG